jgi:glycosyltransferase involved in cell wall biosynthesis
LERNQRQHNNLRIVVHEKNLGLGGARNTGIREAKGNYLWFVDSDDLVTAKELKALTQIIIEQELDVLCFNYRRVDEKGRELSTHRVFNNTSTYEGCAFVKAEFGKGIVNHMGYVWRFIYRADYLRQHQLFFPEHVRWEDTVFMPKALLEANRVAAISDVLYSYRVNANSISGTFGSAYPASSIFEFAFYAGGDLLRFSDEVKDEELKNAFRNTAVQKYINGFPIHLFRTSRSERKKFYALVKGRKAEVNPLRSIMTIFRKWLLLPVIGPVLAEIGSAVYGVNHKRQ